MPAVTLYRLRPRGPMRFGARGIELEGALPFPTAATIFSAWCWAIRDLAGAAALDRLLAAFQAGEPPFLLAAPLPWIGDTLLLPRPALPARRAPELVEDAPRDKRGKRYRWVEEGLWFRLTRGEPTGDAFDDAAAFHQDQTIWAAGEAGGALREWLAALASANELARDAVFWRVATRPHVAVDRLTGAGNIYHTAATWFAPGVDLALPLIWRDESVRDPMERALLLLGETGIGGERNAGYGQFALAGQTTRDWPDLGAAAAFVTLAGLHPTPAEARAGLFAEPAAYDFELSRGWLARGHYRHGVRLVSAGSVLRRLPGQERYGELVNVTPAPQSEHPVYRYGYAFPLPVTGVEREAR